LMAATGVGSLSATASSTTSSKTKKEASLHGTKGESHSTCSE